MLVLVGGWGEGVSSSLMECGYLIFRNFYIVSPEGSVTISVSSNISTIGGEVIFNCSSMGGPVNDYAWMKNGENIGTDSIILVTNIDASFGGSYTCSVSNAAGSGSASTTLYVEPYIVTPLEEQTLTTNGSNVNINCNAAGFPSPTVTWVDMTSMEVSDRSLLQFSPVLFGDEGLYRCEAIAEINNLTFSASNETTVVGRFKSKPFLVYYLYIEYYCNGMTIKINIVYDITLHNTYCNWFSCLVISCPINSVSH